VEVEAEEEGAAVVVEVVEVAAVSGTGNNPRRHLARRHPLR
jgi:hypothetical protein